MSHERVAIVDPSSGKQPLVNFDGNLVLAANGEIYNHRNIRKLTPNYTYKTGSDCEVILALYEQKGVDFIDDLNGIFSFVIYDSKNKSF